MKGFRSATLALWVTVAAIAGCGPIDEPKFASDVERELGRGRAYATTIVVDAREAPTREEAIAVGYLERLRLGLGSPFRLIEYALQDPRLEREDRERLAWALLSRIVDGRAYVIDPRALAQGIDVPSAVRHVELIEGAVRGSMDADGGALAVRLAYAMAGAETSVPSRLPRPAAQVAALARDRIAARDDARRLLRAAGGDTDPLSLVSVWRVERMFAVEAPSMLALSPEVELHAIELASQLLDAVRAIGERPRMGPVVPTPETRQRSLLSPAGAAVLARAAQEYDSPPQTPVAVAVDMHRRAGVPARDEWEVRARERFFDGAVNEERLAAEYAILSHAVLPDQGSRLAVLSAAVGLRAYAQERPWFPGFGGPARRELEDRYGLAGVDFPESVPGHWRPYYRRMLQTSLADMQRVMPSLDVRGLRVRFEARQGSPRTLAVHDPRSRTIYMPAATGAGTLAHEVAHDLDWQTALGRYRVRGDYGTDHAMRIADDRFARSLRGLAAASLMPADAPGANTAHASRPAEIFARSVDWFVAVALARDGRINGYLSSVQDDVLTGYGTVTPPDVSGAAGQALMDMLDEVAPVYPETRRWFLESYGRMRSPTAYDLVRRILEAPLGPDEELVLEPAPSLTVDLAPDAADSLAEPRPDLQRLAATVYRLDRLEAARDSLLTAVDGACSAIGYDDRLTSARRRVVELASAARGRGIATRAAQDLVGPDGRRWTESQIDGRSRVATLDVVVMEALQPLAEQARLLGEARVSSGGLMFDTPAAACGVLPFVSAQTG